MFVKLIKIKKNISCLPNSVWRRLSSPVSQTVYAGDDHLLYPKQCTQETIISCPQTVYAGDVNILNRLFVYTVKNLFHFIYILEWSFSLLSRVCLLISHLSKSMVHSPSLNWKEILNCRCNLENFQLINNFCLSSIISQGKFKKSPWLSG